MPGTELQKSTVIDIKTAREMFTATSEESQMSRAVVPTRRRSNWEQRHTALRPQSVRNAVAVEEASLNHLDLSARDLMRVGETANTLVHETSKQTGEPQEHQHLIALERGERELVASGEEIEKLPTGESLPVLPDAKYPRLMNRDIYPVAINQDMKALQPINQKAIAIRTAGSLTIHQASSREVSRYEPPGAVSLRPDALPLAPREATYLPGKTGSGRLLPPENTYRQGAVPLDTIGEAQALVRTKNRGEALSRAESIVLAAIRSQADIDGKNARVAYDSLAAMTGYSRRHVVRVVKSLISERGLLWVNKRRLKPGHNAINIYHLVNRDVTASEKGKDIKRGKTVQPEAPRVTEPVTQIAKPRTFPTLRHAQLNSVFVAEKQRPLSLTADNMPRYFAQEITPPPEEKAVFLASPAKTTAPKALEGF